MLVSARKQLAPYSFGSPASGALPRLPGSPLPTFVEMPVRTILDWTPEEVGQAILQADTGNLTRAGDLCERLMSDARIRGILSTRTYGLFGLPMEFHGPARQQTALKGTDDEPGDWWTMFPEADLAKLTAWGIVLGIGVGQRVRDPNRAIGELDTPTLRVWHPRWLRHQQATSQGPEKWFLATVTGEIEIHPGDGEWILYMPYGSGRPWAEGAWRALAEAWILKQFAKHDRARFTEVSGSPVRVGVAPQGANEKTRRSWLKQLKAMGRDTAMVLPAGYDLKAVQVGGDGWQIYGASVDLADKDIAIALTGQFVTTEGTKGFASGDIHETIAQSLIKTTAESLSTSLHEQALKPWAGANFGTPDKAAWATWDIQKPEDKKARAEGLSAWADAMTKANALLASIGKRVSLETSAQNFGLDLEDIPEQIDKAPSIPLAPTDVVKVVRVDEARAGAGLSPWGNPDGQLSVSQFDAKYAPAQPFGRGGGGFSAPEPPPPIGPKQMSTPEMP